MSSEGDAMYGVSTVGDGATTSHTGDTEGRLYKAVPLREMRRRRVFTGWGECRF